MTDRELRKLNRAELIEMLLYEKRRVDELESLLDDANARLNERRVRIAEAGTLADACLKLNGVFEAAQAACSQYEENLRAMAADEDSFIREKRKAAERECSEITAAARKECEDLRSQTARECEEMKEKTVRECRLVIAKAKQSVKAAQEKSSLQARELWEKNRRRLDEYRVMHGIPEAPPNWEGDGDPEQQE